MTRWKTGLVAILAAALLLLAALLTGCSAKTAEASDGASHRLWGYSGRMVKWVGNDNPSISFFLLVDQETGVQYLCAMAKSGVSVTPLLEADGTPCKVVE